MRTIPISIATQNQIYSTSHVWAQWIWMVKQNGYKVIRWHQLDANDDTYNLRLFSIYKNAFFYSDPYGAHVNIVSNWIFRNEEHGRMPESVYIRVSRIWILKQQTATQIIVCMLYLYIDDGDDERDVWTEWALSFYKNIFTCSASFTNYLLFNCY